ncbi:NADP(H)-dependent aldo-keto reductase [Iodidimonas sp. SYSU 1G8]|uniref:NADP(H)-dependent aldo-keto reductase n=1 Tax=Iodidimonas sp. SYSU 1G8 TaxID=3133967 RepID=UPI0031FEC673
MEYRRLGRTDLTVSAICLGTMTWGQQNTEAEAHEQLDYALGEGINFIDTAEMYPVPPRPETQGRTEAYIGSWIASRKNRDRFVLATKVSGAGRMNHIRDGNIRLDRKNIEAAVDASLKRLQTDYIDLYQFHWPDRKTNHFGTLGYVHKDDPDTIPVAETLAVMQDIIRTGKVRHIGVSNETAWGLLDYVRQSETKGLPRIATIQNPYNFLNRLFEIALAEISHREEIGLLAYSPLAMGILSGKYLGGAKPEGARRTLFDRFTRYDPPAIDGLAARYVKLARDHGLDPSQMALAFVTSRPFVASNLIGATSMEQLKTDIASKDVTLSEDVLKGIEEIHNSHANPAC